MLYLSSVDRTLQLNNVNKHLNDTVITTEYFKVFETEI